MSNENGASGDGDELIENEECRAYSRFAPHTRELRYHARWWMRWRKELTALKQQGAEYSYDVDIDDVGRLKNRCGRRTKKVLKNHPLWSFLENLSGLGGPTTAYIIGMIRDPWRFPGQPCSSDEHREHVRPEFEEGASCPIVGQREDDEPVGRCGAPLLAPRSGTGVKSLHHYCGLFPGAQQKDSVACSWDPELKGLCLAPDTGLAAQIVMQKPEPYRSTYDEEKERLLKERDDIEQWRAHKIARTIAVKEFVGDLLMAWKSAQPLGSY